MNHVTPVGDNSSFKYKGKSVDVRKVAHAWRRTNILSFLAAAYIAPGQDKKARAVMKMFLDKSNHRSPRLYKRKEDLDRYLDPLRKAGMPE